jgi:branched-chain amino acid transport system ATP-binding protein
VTGAGREPLLEVTGLYAGYHASEVLHGVDMTVRPGEAVALIGPNGAGKSTLLATIVGSTKARRGTIRFDGHELQKRRMAQRIRQGIVLVPEGRQVFPTLTVRENLWLGGFVAPTERDESMQAVLEVFPRLGERLGQRAGTLSGGEQQMLAIGRGLVAKPTLLMIDEPSLGLAPVLIEVVVERLKTLRRQLGIAMLIAEQGVTVAKEVCDRVYVLGAGRVQATVGADISRDELHHLYLGANSAGTSPARPARQTT